MPTATEALASTGAEASSQGSGGSSVIVKAQPAPSANADAFWNGWADPADKDVKEWVQNKNFPDVKTMARSALGYERMIGADRAGRTVVLPADEYDAKGNLIKADEAGRKAYYSKIGVPESPDKYDIPIPTESPYPQFKSMVSQMFHENGVPARMATGIAKGYEGVIAKMEQEMRADEDRKSQADMMELERSWGANYQERMAVAKRGSDYLAQQIGGLSETQQRTLESVLGTAKYMTFMWKVGAGNSEARFAGNQDGGSGQGFGTSAGDAQSRLSDIQARRSQGAIKDYEWRELSKPGGELDQLRDKIVSGFAQH